MRTLVAASAQWWRSILAGGDDYEVLAAVPRESATRFEAAAAAAGVDVTPIGAVIAGSGVTIIGSDGRPLHLGRAGWDHFN
jgi:thiamine-monophosphate kinase